MLTYIASAPQYRAHIQPVWDVLPDPVKGPGEAVLVASWVDLREAKRRRYSRIALMEHGIGQSYGNGHPSYPGGRRRDAVSLFLAPNETSAAMDRRAYPAARVEVVGSPRLDTLPQRVGPPGEVVAVTSHWDSRVAPETRSAFPFFRDAIVGLAERYEVIGHSHPRLDLSRDYRAMRIEYVRDFDDVLRRADVLIADNTSVLYEFASTERPVVVLNGPLFRKDRHHGLRFWDAAAVGVQVDDPAELAEAVQDALSDPLERRVAREAALSLVYQPRTGGPALAAAAILDWLAEPQEAAA